MNGKEPVKIKIVGDETIAVGAYKWGWGRGLISSSLL